MRRKFLNKFSRNKSFGKDKNVFSWCPKSEKGFFFRNFSTNRIPTYTIWRFCKRDFFSARKAQAQNKVYTLVSWSCPFFQQFFQLSFSKFHLRSFFSALLSPFRIATAKYIKKLLSEIIYMILLMKRALKENMDFYALRLYGVSGTGYA